MKKLLRFGDRELAEVKDACGQYRIGAAFDNRIDQVLRLARATAGYHGDRHRIADRSRDG